MQNDFLMEDSPMQIKCAAGIIGNIQKVLEKFRKERLSIFFIVKVNNKDGSDVEITRREKFASHPYVVEGTRGAQIIDELRPQEDEFILKKPRMDAFLFTDLDLQLRCRLITDLVITGIQTANCIRATAYSAVAYGYNTYLVEDAVAANSEQIHRANILDMQNIGIKIVKTAEVLRDTTK
jgi:nicotinamidase-related amidase